MTKKHRTAHNHGCEICGARRTQPRLRLLEQCRAQGQLCPFSSIEREASGPTAFWLKEPHALAALNSEGVEEETREAELARAAQAALEVAQVRRPRKG